MEEGTLSPAAFRFEEFELDVHGTELRRNGLPVHLQPQPLKILLMLVRSNGRLVTREELEQGIWSNQTFVGFDDGVNHAISKLREVFGDSVREPHFISTVPRLGYRFLPSVQSVPASDIALPVVSVASQQGRTIRSTYRLWPPRLWLMASLIAVTLLALGLVARFLVQARYSGAVHSIALLPMLIVTSQPGDEQLADTMTNAIIAKLSQDSSLRVVPHASVMRYKRTTRTISELGRELRVDAIVEASLQRSDGRIRVAVKLTRTADQRNIWAEVLDRDETNLFAMQDQIAADIALELRTREPN